MREKKRQNEPSKALNRRNILKSIGAATTGLAGIGMTTSTVSANNPPPVEHVCSGTGQRGGCPDGDNTGPPGGGGKDYHVQTSQFGRNQSYTTHLVSGFEHVDTNYTSNGDYWTHNFRVAGQGITVDNDEGDIANQLTSHNIFLQGGNNSNGIFTSKSNQGVGAYPQARNVPEDAIVSAGESLVGAVASAAGSTVGSIAVTAGTILQAIYQGVTKYFSSGINSYQFGWVPSGTIGQVAHHAGFYVREDNDGSNHTFQVRSGCNKVNNVWDVHLNQGAAYIDP